MHHHLHPLDSDKKLDRRTPQQTVLANSTADRVTTDRCNTKIPFQQAKQKPAKQVSQKELDALNDDSKLSIPNLVLLENAKKAPLTVKAIVENMESSLAVKPTSLHWKQVLSSYANAVRWPYRSVESATLLYELLQSKKVDVFSLAHALRACNDVSALEDHHKHPSNVVETFWNEKETFARLALAVAQRVWNGLEQQRDRNTERDEIESLEPTDKF